MTDIQGHIQSTLFHTESIDTHLVAREPFNKGDIRSLTNQLSKIGWTETDFFDLRRDTNFTSLVCNMILQASKNSKDIGPTHILLRGEPSAGKTTELRRIAQLVMNSSPASQILPLYTELQYSRTKPSIKTSLWHDIASGCTNPEFELLPEGQSLDAFVKLSRDVNHHPLIFIDTLDILLLQLDENTTNAWSDFLQDVTELGVPIVWTCRPHEWKTFEPNITEMVNERIITIDLPPLNKRELNPFISPEGFSHKEFEDTYQTEWEEWTKEVQANVPIFAHRSMLPSIDKRRLPEQFYATLGEMFEDYLSLDLGGTNPLDVLDGKLPTSHYYRCLIHAKYSSFAFFHYQPERRIVTTRL